ncbi:MAG: hypothetical protein HYW14_01035 [Planctomycetes bacterium]|nr:hypothetical protein [Planctomycetota bacterium]
MNLRTKKNLNYLLTFLLLIGVAVFVYFFIPAVKRLKSEGLLVTQLQEKLTGQKQAIEVFRYPTEEEKHLWNESKQRLEAMCQLGTDAILFEELAKHAGYCDISDIIITPQDSVGAGFKPAPTMEGLPLGVKETKSLLKISFHADNESLGKFLQWFYEHPQHVSVLSLTIKRELPLAFVEMEIEAHLLSCDF